MCYKERIWPTQLIRDALAILGGSKCECLSVLGLKDTYHSIKLSGVSKPHCDISFYFGSFGCIYQGMAKGLSTSPAILHSHLNNILWSIAVKSKYLAIMDDLLLLISEYCHLKYLGDLFKVLFKSSLKYNQISVKILEQNYNISVPLSLPKTKESELNN